MPPSDNFVLIPDDLADLIATNRGTKISNEHATFAGAYHTGLTVEGGAVKVFSNPGQLSIPTQYRGSHLGTAAAGGAAQPTTTAVTAAQNALMTAAVAFAKASGG